MIPFLIVPVRILLGICLHHSDLPASFSVTVRTVGVKETQCGHHGAHNSAGTGPEYLAMSLSDRKFTLQILLVLVVTALFR